MSNNSSDDEKVGKKDDADKMPIVSGLFNYFPRALLAVANQSKYGAKKYEVDYEDSNWDKVEDAERRYNDARGRHIVDQAIDGLYDVGEKGSGNLHAAAVAWNALAYLELLLRHGTPLHVNDTGTNGKDFRTPGEKTLSGKYDMVISDYNSLGEPRPQPPVYNLSNPYITPQSSVLNNQLKEDIENGKD